MERGGAVCKKDTQLRSCHSYSENNGSSRIITLELIVTTINYWAETAVEDIGGRMSYEIDTVFPLTDYQLSKSSAIYGPLIRGHESWYADPWQQVILAFYTITMQLWQLPVVHVSIILH